MEDLLAKFNELPDNAQYVIMGAGGLIGLLVLVLIVLAILSVARGAGGSDKPGKVKMPKRLPMAPVPIMTDDEHALHRVLLTAIASFPGYEVHAKVSTLVMLGANENEHPKIAKTIKSKIIPDAHDFVIVDRTRTPVAVVELYSQEGDEREEQARRAGIIIIRVRDPRISQKSMVDRLKGILL